MMQKARSNSSAGFANPSDVTVLWHGWLKKLGGFSKRWRKRYFLFISTPSGMKELRHYDHYKDVQTLLASSPKGIITLTDAVGVCCFLPPSPPTTKKPTLFNRSDGDNGAEMHDQKFAVLTPLHVHLLAFQNGREWAPSSESQQGLSLLAALSAFYPAVDVLHSGWMSKRRERTTHGPKSIISIWKRHFFMYLNSGDLLYFRDETLNEIQGRVDVRHAPTVRVTGERMINEKKKESIFKFSKLPAFERENCLIWIATPPSKMFVIKVQDESDAASGGSKKQTELTAASKKWLSLLLKGHAETKYTQLEQCIALGKYDQTPEIISAVRAGIPDELRGQLWKGFSRAAELQRRAELKRAIKQTSTPTTRRSASVDSSTLSPIPGKPPGASSTPGGLYEEYAAPVDAKALQVPENQMIFSRLCALALHESQLSGAVGSMAQRKERVHSNTSNTSGTSDGPGPDTSRGMEMVEELESFVHNPPRNTLKQVEKGKLGSYVYPSDMPSAEWEITARRRLLVATSRFNPFSHPCPWRVMCLLLAYLEEESAFWIINSIFDMYLPGYYHGYRPALQIDVCAFDSLLQDRSPALYAHLKALDFPIDRHVERWFLSMFTSTAIPLPTVLRIWDAFFAQGLRIFFGAGIALLLKAEEKLFRSKTSTEAEEYLRATERGSIDADALFGYVFKDDLNISWLTDDQLERVRMTHRQRVMESVTQNVEHFNEKLAILSSIQDMCRRYATSVQQYIVQAEKDMVLPISRELLGGDDPFESEDQDAAGSSSLMFALNTLVAQLRAASDAVAVLSKDFNKRQAKWLALSSQLSACPLGKCPNSDLQSWLWQVKGGKISGAGHDSFYAATDNDGFASVTRLVESSDLFFDDGSVETTWSCLMSAREDLRLSHRASSEVHLYALVSAIKAALMLRLECLHIALRVQWHAGRWIDSSIEFMTIQDESVRRSSHVKASSSSSFKRKSRTLDDSDIAVRTTAEDMRNRRAKNLTMTKHQRNNTFEYGFQHQMSIADSAPTSPPCPPDKENRFNHGNEGTGDSGSMAQKPRTLFEIAQHYHDGEQTFRGAVDGLMQCFSKFIRVEARVKGWDLRERAFLLEEDLQQEIRDVETEVRGSQWSQW